MDFVHETVRRIGHIVDYVFRVFNTFIIIDLVEIDDSNLSGNVAVSETLIYISSDEFDRIRISWLFSPCP
jgi:hypothetical protein